MKHNFYSYHQIPITMTADDVATALRISLSKAYELMHSEGFPTLYLAKRMVVNREKFLAWLEL